MDKEKTILKILEKTSKETLTQILESNSKEKIKQPIRHKFDRSLIGGRCQVCGCTPSEALNEPCIDYKDL